MSGTLPQGVHRFLDASSSHLTMGDTHLLDRWQENMVGSNGPMRVIEHEHGWWINVPSDDFYTLTLPGLLAAGASESFRLLMHYAYDNGCWWINLDRDAEEIEAIPTHEWEDEPPEADGRDYAQSTETATSRLTLDDLISRHHPTIGTQITSVTGSSTAFTSSDVNAYLNALSRVSQAQLRQTWVARVNPSLSWEEDPADLPPSDRGADESI